MDPDDERPLSVQLLERQGALRKSRTGLALLASLVIGFSPLSDAFSGRGSFEDALLRFVACVVACLMASVFVGRLLDAAPARPVSPSTETALDPSATVDRVAARREDNNLTS